MLCSHVFLLSNIIMSFLFVFPSLRHVQDHIFSLSSGLDFFRYLFYFRFFSYSISDLRCQVVDILGSRPSDLPLFPIMGFPFEGSFNLDDLPIECIHFEETRNHYCSHFYECSVTTYYNDPHLSLYKGAKSFWYHLETSTLVY